MTTFKILFVIALAIPAAVCLYFLLNNMMNEFAVVKKNKNANIDYDVDTSVRRVSYGKKKGSRSERFNAQRDAETPVRQSSTRVSDYERRALGEERSERTVKSRSHKPDKKQAKAEKQEQKAAKKRRDKRDKREKPKKREKVSHSRDTIQLNVPYDYPKDPYADFKRPDLDEVIRNANERDRINRKKL